MLKQRVLTALVLLAVLLPALAAPVRWPFALLVVVMIGAAGWEWARLNAVPGAAAWAVGAFVAAVVGAALAAGVASRATAATAWAWALPLWVGLGVAALRGGVAAWPRWPRGARLLLGAAVLVAAGLAMAQSRAIGLNYLLSVLCLVWAADIAAYFGGRRFGRRKLAPAISPGKSWEGAVCGLLAVLVLALAWLQIDAHAPEVLGMALSPSVYSRLLVAWGWPGLLVAVPFLTAMSVVGDLFESLIKRSAGAKDSSALLPGHGGVLDRIDALLPVLPLALALTAGNG